MNKKIFLILSIAVAALASACSSVPADVPTAVFSVAATEPDVPAFPLRETTRVFYERGNALARDAALEFCAEAKTRFGVALKAEGLRPHGARNDNSVIFAAADASATDAFSLRVTKAHLEISARDAEGFSAGIRKALEK